MVNAQVVVSFREKKIYPTKANKTPVKSSISGYCQDIFSLQSRHLKRKMIKLKTGTLSYQRIFFLQCGQYDRPIKKLSANFKR